MIELDVELVRGTLVLGLVISALLYHFFRLNSGGVVTPPFLAIMVLTGDWLNIAGWAALSFVGYLAIRFISDRLPLPRIWLFFAGVYIPMTVHILGIYLTQIEPLESFSPYLAAGLYITNGLTAYDAVRQGLIRTYITAAGATLLTLFAALGMHFLTSYFGVITEEVPPFVSHDPLIAFVVVSAAIVARLTFGLGTAGIIGGAYLLEIATPQSLLVVFAFTLIGSVIYKWSANFLGLSPKQAFFSLLSVGSIAAWFGSFWASYLGIPGAAEIEKFALEPLLVVGLLIGETARFGIVKTLAGTGFVTLATLVVLSLVSNSVIPIWAAYALTASLFAVSLAVAFKKVKRDWFAAVEGGSRYRPIV